MRSLHVAASFKRKHGWYHRRMLARFGSRFLIAFVALSSAAQQTKSGDLEALLKDGAALSQQADYAHAIPLLERAKSLRLLTIKPIYSWESICCEAAIRQMPWRRCE